MDRITTYYGGSSGIADSQWILNFVGQFFLYTQSIPQGGKSLAVGRAGAWGRAASPCLCRYGVHDLRGLFEGFFDGGVVDGKTV